ncbi:hypothetical protein BDZ94DRAFT_1246758 [Collybia nuda]|uniref:Pheromone receptor n=1 Tax=Collybia nuda TaxID=64659 RepID=A0A9P5YGE9_9AGAR|nr:hypothetical protein BDZ94DRAFT_1246758 [Collybia nuda]
MDSFDFFSTITLTEPGTEFLAGEHANDSSSQSESVIPTDHERTTGYTAHGFCVIA